MQVELARELFGLQRRFKTDGLGLRTPGGAAGCPARASSGTRRVCFMMLGNAPLALAISEICFRNFGQRSSQRQRLTIGLSDRIHVAHLFKQDCPLHQ